jgi:hypothetical protein
MENPGHGLGQRLKKRLGVRVVFRFDFEGASTALSIIGQFDRLAFDGCINRSSRLGSPYTYIQRKVRSIWVPNPTTDEHSAGPDSLVFHTTAIGHFH